MCLSGPSTLLSSSDSLCIVYGVLYVSLCFVVIGLNLLLMQHVANVNMLLMDLANVCPLQALCYFCDLILSMRWIVRKVSHPNLITLWHYRQILAYSRNCFSDMLSSKFAMKWSILKISLQLISFAWL